MPRSKYIEEIVPVNPTAVRRLAFASPSALKKQRKSAAEGKCVRGLEIIGEVVSKLSQDLKDVHPNVPWQQISGLRNRLIHGYFDTQLDRVWKTVEEDVPGFEQAISKIVTSLAEINPDEGHNRS